MQNEIFFSIKNNHVTSCGKPPVIEQKSYLRISYFENIHGEQSIFVYDIREGKAYLWMGDCDWDTKFIWDFKEQKDNFGTNLSEGEKLWLEACLKQAHYLFINGWGLDIPEKKEE